MKEYEIYCVFMRRACKIDRNHTEVVQAFRSLGYFVHDVHQLSNCVDLYISKAGQWFAIEIKDGLLPKSARKLTDGEKKFHQQALGPVLIIESIEQILAFDRKRFRSLPELLGNTVN